MDISCTDFPPPKSCAKYKSWGKNTFTPLRKIWLAPNRYSRNSQMLKITAYRSHTKFHPSRSRSIEIIGKDSFMPLSRAQLLLSYFHETQACSTTSCKKNHPNFMKIRNTVSSLLLGRRHRGEQTDMRGLHIRRYFSTS